VRRLSGALYGVFVLIGIATSTWVTRTPALRDALGASTEQMGLVLFGFRWARCWASSAPTPSRQRLQARRTILLGTCLVLGGLALMAAGAAWPACGVRLLAFCALAWALAGRTLR
jgi:fucose permease